MNEADPVVAEQLRHLIEMLRAESEALSRELAHYRELTNHRLAELESDNKDHESRIRSLQDGVTSFKTWSGLASGGSSILSIVALVRSFFGL